MPLPSKSSTTAGTVVAMTQWRETKAKELATQPALTCPKCEVECAPLRVTSDGSTVYRCTAHRGLTWRIAADGTMFHGAHGNRRYFS